MITATRYHDISCGHRVFGHESKCAHLHGHNYRIHFTVCATGPAPTDALGRVMDFSVIKSVLCEWLEREWDHKFLLYVGDDLAGVLKALDPAGVVLVFFNPTAENMALHLLHDVGPTLLASFGVKLIHVSVEETRKCSAAASIYHTQE